MIASLQKYIAEMKKEQLKLTTGNIAAVYMAY